MDELAGMSAEEAQALFEQEYPKYGQRQASFRQRPTFILLLGFSESLRLGVHCERHRTVT